MKQAVISWQELSLLTVYTYTDVSVIWPAWLTGIEVFVRHPNSYYNLTVIIKKAAHLMVITWDLL